ncbi:hypothetical protein [Cellulosimicrobium funkei]|uniref:Uncharacterized protein n=1 Tax=Cellulosimicrobium funkei TaxID=264251 RepID=A0A4Y8QX04_9MICO|nr:hypothetical protein [Cellulosimicrobium funkei]TFF03724.1 hypothetical protein E1O70_19445 [Cellulosimicrobium funkei]TGA67364.1 hypothetical protein EQW79_019250 [Cellulosimicrobium terreum]
MSDDVDDLLDGIDEALAEIDMLALADAVGVLRGGPIELGSDDPSIPDSDEQRHHRQRLAAQRARLVDQRRRIARSLDRQIATASREATFDAVRDLVEWLISTPSLAELRRRRTEAYERLDRQTPRSNP